MTKTQRGPNDRPTQVISPLPMDNTGTFQAGDEVLIGDEKATLIDSEESKEPKEREIMTNE